MPATTEEVYTIAKMHNAIAYSMEDEEGSIAASMRDGLRFYGIADKIAKAAYGAVSEKLAEVDTLRAEVESLRARLAKYQTDETMVCQELKDVRAKAASHV